MPRGEPPTQDEQNGHERSTHAFTTVSLHAVEQELPVHASLASPEAGRPGPQLLFHEVLSSLTYAAFLPEMAPENLSEDDAAAVDEQRDSNAEQMRKLAAQHLWASGVPQLPGGGGGGGDNTEDQRGGLSGLQEALEDDEEREGAGLREHYAAFLLQCKARSRHEGTVRRRRGLSTTEYEA